MDKRRQNVLIMACIMLATAIGIMFFMFACSTIQTTEYATGYELTAQTLRKIYESGHDKCGSGELTQEQCDILKNLYNDARTKYFLSGNNLIDALNAKDRFQREAALEKYTKHTRDLSEATTKLIRYYTVLLGDLQ